MNSIAAANLTFSAVTGRLPFDQQDKPRFEVKWFDPATDEERSEVIIAPTMLKAKNYFIEEYEIPDSVSIDIRQISGPKEL